MNLRKLLFQKTSGLSRGQKRAIFLSVDTLLPVTIFAAMQFHSPLFHSLLNYACLTILALIAAVSSTLLGLTRVKLNSYGRDAVLVTAKYSVSCMFGLLIVGKALSISMQTLQIIEFGTLVFLFGIANRFVFLTALLWVLRQGTIRQRVLIYGAGDTGLQMAQALRHHPSLQAIAFLDDDVELQGMMVAGLKVLSPARLNTDFRELAIDRVLLALPSLPAAKLTQITRKLLEMGLDVQALPSFAQLAGAKVTLPAMAYDIPTQLLGRSDVAGDMPDAEAAYQGKVVMVSGAGGSVGSELCRQILKLRPKTLVLFERSEIALYSIDQELREIADRLGVSTVPVLGSVTDARLALSTMIETGTEVVFHAAAYKHVPLIEINPVAGLANNVLGTHVFAKAALAAGVKVFVLISTDKAVRPQSVMGATKRLSELVVNNLAQKRSETAFSIVRFGNVLGSSGSVLPLFRDQIRRGGPVTLTHEDVTRYFMSLAEAARLVLLSGAFPKTPDPGAIFVLEMGKPIRIKSLAERMIKAEGLTVKNDLNPSGDIEIVLTGLRRGEKLHEELLVSGKLMPTAHPKILKIEDPTLSDAALTSALNASESAVQLCDQDAARAVLCKWVDGFPDHKADLSAPARLNQMACLTSYQISKIELQNPLR